MLCFWQGNWLVSCYRICFAQERIDWWSCESDGVHHVERERRGGLPVDWGNWHTLQVGGSYQGWQLKLGEGLTQAAGGWRRLGPWGWKALSPRYLKSVLLSSSHPRSSSPRFSQESLQLGRWQELSLSGRQVRGDYESYLRLNGYVLAFSFSSNARHFAYFTGTVY